MVHPCRHKKYILPVRFFDWLVCLVPIFLFPLGDLSRTQHTAHRPPSTIKLLVLCLCLFFLCSLSCRALLPSITIIKDWPDSLAIHVDFWLQVGAHQCRQSFRESENQVHREMSDFWAITPSIATDEFCRKTFDMVAEPLSYAATT